MKKLALFTPWPPQHSGIADYSFDLAAGLTQQGVQVSVFTDSPGPHQTEPPVDILPTELFPGPASFDRVVYQLGNSGKFHASMIVPLGEHGGIVHLHDTVLHHLVHDLTAHQGNGKLYYQLVGHWYGSKTVDDIYQWHRTSEEHFAFSAGVIDVPLFDPVLRFADGCIVHSEFGRQRVKQRFPNLPCEVVPQTYRNKTPINRASAEQLRVGAFGLVTLRTHIDLLLRAVADAISQGAKIHLDVAGQLDRRGESLPELATQLGIDQHVTFHGRIPQESFQSLMRSADLCVAQRFPTMGETSGVVSQALQLGLPTIVTDVGWPSELPDFVSKLPADRQAVPKVLGELLTRHALDSSYHQDIRRQAVQYAQDVASFTRVNERYISILESFPSVSRTDLRKPPKAA